MMPLFSEAFTTNVMLARVVKIVVLVDVVKLTVGKDGCAMAGLTVNIAGLLVTVPWVFVTTHLNCVPLSDTAVAGVVYDMLLAPLIFVKVIPPLVLSCH